MRLLQRFPSVPSRKSGVRRQRPATSVQGFTLVELMVSIAVLSIIVSLAAPSFAETIAANRLTTQADALKAALSLAHAEAVRRAQPVTLRATDADNFLKGWNVFPDADADGSPAGATNDADGRPLQAIGAAKGAGTAGRVTRSAAPAPFTYTSASDAARARVTFNSRGALISGSPAFFRLCDPKNPAVKGRIVQVNVVGKSSIDSNSVACN